MAATENKIPTVILIGGNRGSGKNTFANQLCNSELQFHFDIFKRTLNNGTELQTIIETGKYTQISFANYLKHYVALMVGISPDLIEELKDQPMTSAMLARYGEFLMCKPQNNPPTLRDALINTAAENLVGNWDYYADIAYKKHIKSDTTGEIFLVTDWRYEAEYHYFLNLKHKKLLNLYTICIVNDEVKPVDVPSERSLDRFNPQFIAIPSYQNQGKTRREFHGNWYKIGAKI